MKASDMSALKMDTLLALLLNRMIWEAGMVADILWLPTVTLEAG